MGQLIIWEKEQHYQKQLSYRKNISFINTMQITSYRLKFKVKTGITAVKIISDESMGVNIFL